MLARGVGRSAIFRRSEELQLNCVRIMVTVISDEADFAMLDGITFAKTASLTTVEGCIIVEIVVKKLSDIACGDVVVEEANSVIDQDVEHRFELIGDDDDAIRFIEYVNREELPSALIY